MALDAQVCHPKTCFDMPSSDELVVISGELPPGLELTPSALVCGAFHASQLRDAAVAIEPLSPRHAAQLRELADRAKELGGKASKLFGDKLDLLRKGTPYIEISKKLGPALEAAADAHRKWAARAEDVCDL